MALFLESVESTVSAKYSNLSFNEMLCEGMLIGDEMLALNEAIYKADFIIHQRSQNLSESAQLLQESGFLGTVWEKVKNMVKKVWEWIKATWSKFTAKLSEWANRIMDRMSGNTEEVRKSVIKKADLLEDFASKLLPTLESTVDKITAASDNTAIKDGEDKINDLFTRLEEDGKEADKLEGRVTVSKTFAKKVADTGKRIEKATRATIIKLEKLQAAIDKDMRDIIKDNTDENGNQSIKPTSSKSLEGKYVSTSTDQQDNNSTATANKKIGFIQKVTNILRKQSSGSMSDLRSALSAISANEAKDDKGDSFLAKYKEL